MIIFTMKTSRGGRPKTFTNLIDLLAALCADLGRKCEDIGGGKIIIEVKDEKEAK